MKNSKIYVLFLILFALSIPIFAQGEEGQSVIDIILGGMTLNYFLAMLLIALVGVVVNMVSDIQRRDKPSKSSPEGFSLKYWWKDNWKRVTATAILLPIALLTSADMFGLKLTTLNAFMIGFGADHLMEIAKRKKLKLIKGI